MRNPYHIQGPALISVSGGRTSGFMLRQIIDAHGGKLPADVIPVFCNTGLEHEATLQFLREIGDRWTPLVWLEYDRITLDDGTLKHWFKQVDYCTASRKGEPFDKLIKAKNTLPNVHQRFCTSELKIRTGNRYAKSLGWSEFARAVGLRYDEPRRVHRLTGEGNEDATCPMYHSRHTLVDVREFWSQQDFDLQLPGDDNAFGNCQLCFLKSQPKIGKVMRTDPEVAAWWISQEERRDIGATGNGRLFRIDRPTYRQMFTQLTVQGQLYDDAIIDDTESLPCNCTD